MPQKNLYASPIMPNAMDTPTRTLAAERPARVYDPMATPSVSRGSYGHYLRRNANRSATTRAHKSFTFSHGLHHVGYG